MRSLVLLLLAVPLAATGCTSASCDRLPALQEQVTAERAAYARLVASGAPPERTAEADDALHRLERRVYDLAQQCIGR